MKKVYLLIVMCMLLIVGCNGGKNSAQLIASLGSSEEVEKSGVKMSDEDKNREKESEQFCKQFPMEGLMEIIDRPASAEKYGLAIVHEEDTEGEEGDADYSEIIYGRDIEKIEKEDGGYELKSMTGHSCFVRIVEATCDTYSIGFSNEEDANSFFKKVLNYGVIDEGEYYVIPEERLPKGKPVKKDAIDDYQALYSISRPEFEDGFYQIRLDRFM